MNGVRGGREGTFLEVSVHLIYPSSFSLLTFVATQAQLFHRALKYIT